MKKKIRLSVLVTIGFTISLLLVTISYSFITVKNIRKIGNYAVSINEENLKDISSSFFLEVTRRTAKKYARYFKDAEQITNILAEQISRRTLSDKVVSDVEPEKEIIKFHRYKNRDFYVSNNKDGITAYYWGNHEDGGVPKKVLKEVNAINLLTPMLEGFIKCSDEYFSAVWIHSRDDYMFMCPATDAYYKNMLSRSAFNKYFNVFDIISAHKEKPKIIKSFWLDPYKDVTGVTVASVFTPVYDKNNNIIAAVGLDLNLNKLMKSMLASRLIADTQKSDNIKDNSLHNNSLFHDFLFLINKNSSILTFPKEYADLFSLPPDFSDLTTVADSINTKLTDSKDIRVRKMVERIIKTDSGVGIINLKGNDYFIAHSRLEGTNFILGFVVSEDILLSSTKQTGIEINNTELAAIKNGFLISLVVLAISIIIALLFFRRYIFNPLERFRRKVKRMGEGEFGIRFREEGLVEMSELGATFNYLGKELRAYMKNLKDEIKVRQQIETEVKIAAGLQLSFLPKVDKSFERSEFSMAAKLSSAKEASGDYFDFFYLDDNKITLIIADVVGKGIPAAFYMGMVKTLLKNICYQEKEDPAKALNRVNRILSQDNSTLMFVTLFICYYDIKTGKMRYANAGHHEAICISKTGVYRQFGTMKGIAIGVTDQRKYISRKTIINKGDTVVLYTDGVIEAVSPNEEDYGEVRFKQLLIENRRLSSENLANKIIESVREFEHDKRYDDVTVITLRRSE